MTYRCLQGMLTIEAFLEPQSQLKITLKQDEIAHLNQQISKELATILPHLDDSSYAIVGGLYQSSELLQPGFPIHTQLRQYANAALKGENNRRNQLVIGANSEGLPVGLKHNQHVQTTPLLLMPFVLITEHDDTKEIFENQLMHKGMGSVKLLQLIQETIQVKVRHVNFMTVLDLAAMMHNHLEMAGVKPLWKLLEQALFNSHPETKIKTDELNEFYLSKKIVFTPFFTGNYWKNNIVNNSLHQNNDYFQYLMRQRQYIATFLEHGLDVRQFLPTTEIFPVNEQHICFATLNKNRLTGDYYHEILQPLKKTTKPSINKKSHPHLGVTHYHLTDGNSGSENYYPMSPKGIKFIEHLIKQN